jgi:hypothetical protein
MYLEWKKKENERGNFAPRHWFGLSGLVFFNVGQNYLSLFSRNSLNGIVNSFSEDTVLEGIIANECVIRYDDR